MERSLVGAVWFHPQAEKEFNEAIRYYEQKEAGLGADFAIEVRYSIDRIIAQPEAWPVLKGEIRRTLLRRFPYGVLYSAEPQGVFIVAVMHLNRSPEYWKSRE